MLRLAKEIVVPVADLVLAARVSAKSLERWIVQGKRGRWLDGFRDGGTGEWMSSAEALERFRADQAAIDGAGMAVPRPAA